MATFNLHLRDLNRHVCNAWEPAFADQTTVDVACTDIFDTKADAIVSPANSFGFMDGGIDLAYLHRFGFDLQDRLRARIHDEWHGELPIGAALLIETGDTAIPWMVCAPTMRVPEDVHRSVNAYLAFRATLLAIRTHNDASPEAIQSILCPGLATLTGSMAPGTCARQMRYAWDSWDREAPPSTREIVEKHNWMSD